MAEEKEIVQAVGKSKGYVNEASHAKEFADLLATLFARTPQLTYSSGALLAMAERFKELLNAGVPEQALIDHCRQEVANFSQKLVKNIERRENPLIPERPVDAMLIRKIFKECPKPPGPIFEARKAIDSTTPKELFAGERKASRKR